MKTLFEFTDQPWRNTITPTTIFVTDLTQNKREQFVNVVPNTITLTKSAFTFEQLVEYQNGKKIKDFVSIPRESIQWYKLTTRYDGQSEGIPSKFELYFHVIYDYRILPRN
jgi:hypothetical protein